MTGKSHLAANVSCAVISLNILSLATVSSNQTLCSFSDKSFEFLIGKSNSFNPFLWVTLGSIFFLIGSILPDIDSEKSMISKLLHFHLPFEHRTWTHSIWAVALLIICSLAFRPFVFMLAGYVMHLFWDAFSSAGVCFFYPIDKYRSYGNGAKVKKGHKLKLYHTGQASEYILLGIIMTLTVLMCIWLIVNGTYANALNIIKQTI